MKKFEPKTYAEVVAYLTERFAHVEETYYERISMPTRCEVSDFIKSDYVPLLTAYTTLQTELAQAVQLLNDKWQPLKGETKPKQSGEYLGLVGYDRFIFYYRKDRNTYEVYGAGKMPMTDIKLTHWMPLPVITDELFKELNPDFKD